MKNWMTLGVAICCEVAGSLALKEAQGAPAWMLLTLAADAVAFTLLTVLLKRGMQLSVAYGIWGAGGVALTAIFSTVIFGEPLTLLMGGGIALVIAGVLLVEFGTPHAEGERGDKLDEKAEVRV